LRDLTASYAKDILKGLRELKRFSPLASEMLKVLVDENEPKTVSLVYSLTIFQYRHDIGGLSKILHRNRIFGDIKS